MQTDEAELLSHGQVDRKESWATGGKEVGGSRSRATVSGYVRVAAGWGYKRMQLQGRL